MQNEQRYYTARKEHSVLLLKINVRICFLNNLNQNNSNELKLARNNLPMLGFLLKKELLNLVMAMPRYGHAKIEHSFLWTREGMVMGVACNTLENECSMFAWP